MKNDDEIRSEAEACVVICQSPGREVLCGFIEEDAVEECPMYPAKCHEVTAKMWEDYIRDLEETCAEIEAVAGGGIND